MRSILHHYGLLAPVGRLVSIFLAIGCADYSEDKKTPFAFVSPNSVTSSNNIVIAEMDDNDNNLVVSLQF